MAGWNGSDRKGAAPVQPKVTYPPSEASFAKQSGYRGAKKPSPVRGLIAGGAVVALAVVAYFVFFAGTDKPQTEKADKDRGRIKEVTPAAAPTNKVVEAKEPKKRDFRYEVPEGSYRAENGRLYTPTGRRILEHEPTRILRMGGENDTRIFKSMAENQIMKLVAAKPGAFMMPLTFGPSFIHSFEKSLERPIEILPDDSEEVKAIKRDVIEAKEELAKQYRAGIDISQIMKDTQQELMQLSRYRQDLHNNVVKFAREEGVTEQDIEDYAAAANKLLKERGMPPIKSAKLHSIRLRNLARQQQNGGTKK